MVSFFENLGWGWLESDTLDGIGLKMGWDGKFGKGRVRFLAERRGGEGAEWVIGGVLMYVE